MTRPHFLRTRSLRSLLVAAVAFILVGMTGGVAQAGPGDHFGTAPANGGAFYLTNLNSQLCMDVTDARSANGTWVRQYQCDLARQPWNQQFVLAHVGIVNGRDAWRIKPRFAQDKCLDVHDGVTVEGEVIQIWTCNSGWQQLFELRSIITNPYIFQISPVYNHWCISSERYTASNLPLVEYPCGGDRQNGASQSWGLSY